jgi:chromosome segregation ATPase
VRELELRLERETAVLIDRLERQADELERLELTLLQTRGERDAVQALAGGLQAELDELTLELARAREDLAQAREDLAQARDELARTGEELAWARSEAAVTEAHLERLNSTHHDLLTSASWRLTRPLRWVKRATVGRQ